MTSKQGIQPAKPLNNGCSTIHSRINKACRDTTTIPPDPSAPLAALESISSFYSYLDNCHDSIGPSAHLNECFAVRLSLLMIEILSTGQFAIDTKGSFQKSFYHACMTSASEAGLAVEIGDDELCIIYIKQCLHLLEKSGILLRNGRKAGINKEEASPATIYSKLFNAFWNKTPWEDIFPSDTESAKELNALKSILKDLILRHPGAFCLDVLSNEFFDMTGFSNQNNLLMISFLDFYFFTWLKHFGMVRYCDGKTYAPVRIRVTDIGRRLLNSY